MSKYSFERLEPARFERMAQALLEKLYRISGNLVQFGDGKDGAREATWTQPVTHPSYERPLNLQHDAPKEWVFQVKYHDISLRGWSGARAEVESELNEELGKLIDKHEVPCHKYVLITNVPFSGVRHVGTRDRVGRVIEKWRDRVPEIEVWDAVDLSRMLDADPETRKTYLADILPGDVLHALLVALKLRDDRRNSAFHAYLKAVIRSEREAKAEEAGDESGLKLEKIFVDLAVRPLLDRSSSSLSPDLLALFPDGISAPLDEVDHISPGAQFVPASFAFLRCDHRFMLLKGGPGVGKSTITQYLALFHAARLVDERLATALTERLKIGANMSTDHIDASCRIRFPLRIELRRYAEWMDKQQTGSTDRFLGRYLAERIARESSSSIQMEDIFALASTNPVLLILDGLDEVSNRPARSAIFQELNTFLDRCEGEASDIQVILSSRPQGYRGEFDVFDPIEWHIGDLSRVDFDSYATRWFEERIPNLDERTDARRRIEDGMKAPSVAQMATTLLQATVMLTIARRKHPIPHARHKLYEKYVEVIFERERNKQTVRERTAELFRLHELVGYTLMTKMESAGGVRPLGHDEFKQCVHQVILDYGPSDLNGKSIGAVVDAIVILAKDRLCLLAGKGDDQTDVDFVIQPFREYFAAAYLARHEDADPDSVFEHLVSRLHIWANVLQFYAAFQSKTQQRSWIAEADGTSMDPANPDHVVTLTRRRRALLRLLPEFERPKNEYILRAAKNVFNAATRWTWSHRQEIGKMLEAFAPGESFSVLSQVFGPLSTSSPSTLRVELDLLAKCAASDKKDSLGKLFSSFEATKDIRDVILEVAARNDIAIPLSEFRSAEITRAIGFVDYDASFSNFVGALSNAQAVELLVKLGGASPLLRPHMPPHQLTALLSSILSCDHRSSPPHIKLPPFLLDRREISTTDVISQLESIESGAASYVVALLKAIRNPTSAELFGHAKTLSEQIKVHDDMSIGRQLGPPPSVFSSSDAWAAWRLDAFLASEHLEKVWLSSISHLRGGMFTLWVHPDAWEELRPSVAAEPFERLLTEVRPLVRRVSPFDVLPVENRVFHQLSAQELLAMCHCVVNVLRQHGPHFVRNDWSLRFGWMEGEAPQVDTAHAEAILAAVQDLEVPPAWAGRIIKLCATAKGVDASLLLALWETQDEVPRIPWFILSRRARLSSAELLIVEQLLKVGTRSAVQLAAFILEDMGPREHTKIGEKLVRALCDIIEAGTAADRKADIAYLLRQVPYPAELRIWAIPDLYREIRWLHLSIQHRFEAMVLSVRRQDLETLRADLRGFLERRSDFPDEVVVAALDGLLHVDEMMSKPLSTEDWQVPRAIVRS